MYLKEKRIEEKKQEEEKNKKKFKKRNKVLLKCEYHKSEVAQSFAMKKKM
jgi:hypothetical protein